MSETKKTTKASSKKSKGKTKTLVVKVSPNKHARFKFVSSALGLSGSAALEKALDKYIIENLPLAKKSLDD